jgi:hypothetical protein
MVKFTDAFGVSRVCNGPSEHEWSSIAYSNGTAEVFEESFGVSVVFKESFGVSVDYEGDNLKEMQGWEPWMLNNCPEL